MERNPTKVQKRAERERTHVIRQNSTISSDNINRHTRSVFIRIKAENKGLFLKPYTKQRTKEKHYAGPKAFDTFLRDFKELRIPPENYERAYAATVVHTEDDKDEPSTENVPVNVKYEATTNSNEGMPLTNMIDSRTVSAEDIS